MASGQRTAAEQAFESHLEETGEQVERLKEAFRLIHSNAKAKPCKGMAGLVEEGEAAIEGPRAE